MSKWHFWALMLCCTVAASQRYLILTCGDVTNNSFSNFVGTISSRIQKANDDCSPIGINDNIVVVTDFTISNHYNKTDCDDNNRKLVVLHNVSEVVKLDGTILFKNKDGTKIMKT